MHDFVPISEIELTYTVLEVANLLHMSTVWVIDHFLDEPGVLDFGHDARDGKRRYHMLRIPRSVFERVCRRVRKLPQGEEKGDALSTAHKKLRA